MIYQLQKAVYTPYIMHLEVFASLRAKNLSSPSVNISNKKSIFHLLPFSSCSSIRRISSCFCAQEPLERKIGPRNQEPRAQCPPAFQHIMHLYLTHTHTHAKICVCARATSYAPPRAHRRNMRAQTRITKGSFEGMRNYYAGSQKVKKKKNNSNTEIKN